MIIPEVQQEFMQRGKHGLYIWFWNLVLWHIFPYRDTDVFYHWQMDGDDNFLIIRSFVITYQIIICKVMLLGRNSFPEREIVKFQLFLCFLGVYFTYIQKLISCLTLCRIWKIQIFLTEVEDRFNNVRINSIRMNSALLLNTCLEFF